MLAGTSRFLGIVYTSLGAVMLSSKGIFAKLLFAQGVDFETVVAVRSVLAIPGFLLLAALSGQRHRLSEARPAHYLLAIAAGLACYYLGAMANFYALTRIDASIERALLYTYPAVVTLAIWLRHPTREMGRILLALTLTMGGILLTVGMLNQDLPPQDLVGVGWVLFCSLTIAFYFIVAARLSLTLGSANFTCVAMGAAGLAFATHYELSQGWQSLRLNDEAWALMITLVVFATVTPLVLVAAGLRRIGAQRAAITSTVAPASAVLLATSVLGESIDGSQLLGIGLIVIGILIIELRPAPRS